MTAMNQHIESLRQLRSRLLAVRDSVPNIGGSHVVLKSTIDESQTLVEQLQSQAPIPQTLETIRQLEDNLDAADGLLDKAGRFGVDVESIDTELVSASNLLRQIKQLLNGD